MIVSRLLLGVLGVAAASFGVVHLLTETRTGTVIPLVVWAAGAVVLHDAVLVPLVLAAGLLVTEGRLRGVWRAALLTLGTVTLVALPPLLRPGRPANPSVLPLAYPLGLAVVAAAVVAGAAMVAGRRLWLARRERQS
ncbi:hypothetical protein [Streptomyces daliensis]|uniref:Uncharacterized protein n=1 Tax=Streptomyces daliensis TaxID=299421 RepID=A0A8T4ILE2_9ACTN|nr:hypothetical protein [Streptomyces daliensis]